VVAADRYLILPWDQNCFMKKIFVLLLVITSIIFLTSFERKYNSSSVILNDSLEKDRAKYIAIINERIKGKEKMMVDSVFNNLKVLGGFPAENLPLAMNSWSRALGVSCDHCHNTNDFADDAKQKKEISRQMVEMGTMISQKLKTIKGLSERPIVNCTTCHRGDLKPALRLPSN
jgi:hypothetical protein